MVFTGRIETPAVCRLDKEHRKVPSILREVAGEEVVPRATEIDREGESTWDIAESYRVEQLLQMPIPIRSNDIAIFDAKGCILRRNKQRACISFKTRTKKGFRVY